MAIDWTDLFAGGGGSSEGIRAAGQDVLIATNHCPVAVATHQKNHPDTEHRTADLNNTNFGSYPRTRALWASPSCTKHSVTSRSKQGTVEEELRRDTADKVDRATAFAVLAAAEIHGYDAVVVENVPKFLRWVLFPAWLSGMHALGYREQIVTLDAAEVGPVPAAQHRPRVFMVFTRDGRIDLVPDPAPRTPAISILDAANGWDDPAMSRSYVAPQIATITEPGVPHLVTYRRNARARRADSSQLQTLCAGGRHHAVATIADDGAAMLRWLTVRELARAQGFPDTYQFVGNDSQVRRQIGNAVAVNVATFLATRIADQLEGVAA